MKAMLNQAERPEHTQIATFRHLRDQVVASASLALDPYFVNRF